MDQITIDLNADIGEQMSPEGTASEHAIMDFVTSVSIACGGHAGDEASMRDRVKLAKAKDVTIGAHPSFPDRKGFGRRKLQLGWDISAATLTKSLTEQIKTLIHIANSDDAQVRYVKPHGTLYTQGGTEPELAALIVSCVADINPALFIMAAPNSALERAAKTKGLSFISEGFIDRRYGDDGQIVPRNSHGALLDTQNERLSQAKSLAFTARAQTRAGCSVRVAAQTLCLHGDSAGALETAKAVHAALEAEGAHIRSFTS